MTLRVAVLGGSKGCARHMVAQGLETGKYEFILLVRNPDQVDYNEEQKAKLTLIKGDALDASAVKQTVEGCDLVVFAIGSTITATFKMTHPGLCQKGMNVLLNVIKGMEHPPKRLIAVTTTGAMDPKEVPLLFRPLYHWALAEPHADKREVENSIQSSSHPFDWIIVRPSLLTDGALTQHYRAESNRLVGYTISRQDVGHFLLNQCLDDDEAKKWINNYVVVTY
ncbi:uncharacterized protein BX664DRAFT_324309 [Halteromyces radiatus]|uniref:uncharacterized protein n=1 Tax=Halteromyces radiatus TaxID=101107 RepID=UPI00221EDC7A|nr:uncharacterized protein BX664DRAFT_324309 [Halteromyces radiatus]KAI8096577.1 hypothetical protein BX664DRAFT_324309 [Halteromyces radiatus]